MALFFDFKVVFSHFLPFLDKLYLSMEIMVYLSLLFHNLLSTEIPKQIAPSIVRIRPNSGANIKVIEPINKRVRPIFCNITNELNISAAKVLQILHVAKCF